MGKFLFVLGLGLISGLVSASPILQGDGTGNIKVLSTFIKAGNYLQDGLTVKLEELNLGKMYCKVEIFTGKVGDNLIFNEYEPAFSRDFKDSTRNYSILIISAANSQSGLYLKCLKYGAPTGVFDTDEVVAAVGNNLSLAFNFSKTYNPNALNISRSKPFSLLVGKTIVVDPDPYVAHPFIKGGKLLSWDIQNPPLNPFLFIEKLFYGPPVSYPAGTKLDVQSFYTDFNIPYNPKLGYKTRTYIETAPTPLVRRGLGFNFSNNDDYSEYGIEDLKREGGDVLKVLN